MFTGLRIPPVWSRIDRTGWAGQTSDEQRPRERSLSQSDGHETGCQNGRPSDQNGEPEVPIGGRSPGRIGQGSKAHFWSRADASLRSLLGQPMGHRKPWGELPDIAATNDLSAAIAVKNDNIRVIRAGNENLQNPREKRAPNRT